jgi:hypothetical protein
MKKQRSKTVRQVFSEMNIKFQLSLHEIDWKREHNKENADTWDYASDGGKIPQDEQIEENDQFKDNVIETHH